MLQAVRIEGLRSLTDTGFIDIKPLTILVGENSSGKSTFLRFFPLLKQSFKADTSGPILWSNPDLVDFGSYQEAAQNNSSKGIHFYFKFHWERSTDSSNTIQERFFSRSLTNQTLDINLMIELSKNIKKETTRVSIIYCEIADSSIKIKINEDGQLMEFKVNSFDVLSTNIKFVATHIDGHSMLPQIMEISDDRENFDFDSESRFMLRLPMTQSNLFNKLREELEVLFESINDEKVEKDRKILLITSFLCKIVSSKEMLSRIKSNKGDNYISFQEHTSNWDLNTQEFIKIRDLAIATTIPYFIEECDRCIANISRNISYVGPARATAEQRSQRFDEFIATEIDPQGRYLSIFLNNLDENSKQEFDVWTSQYFGFKTVVKTNFRHITLNMLFEGSDQEVNIADTGFGFSQMLPIITQLWILSQKNKTSRNKNNFPIIFAIEQPELHLHPRMQKVLTDVLVSTVQAAKDNNIDLRLLIETHSEVLVNQVGNLIYKEKIKPEDVNIVVFDKLPQENSSTVKTAYYNEEGFLKKWPVGFFDPGLE